MVQLCSLARYLSIEDACNTVVLPLPLLPVWIEDWAQAFETTKRRLRAIAKCDDLVVHVADAAMQVGTYLGR